MKIQIPHQQRPSFSLIELLVVMFIVGILATIGLELYNGYQERARDAIRLKDMKQIKETLKLYIVDNNGIPPEITLETAQEDHGCYSGPNVDLTDTPNREFSGNWDRSSVDGKINGKNVDGLPFIPFLQKEGYLTKVPVDPLNDRKPGTSGCQIGQGHTYVFYVKNPGHGECPMSWGRFFLIGVNDMESSRGPHKQSHHFPECAGPGGQLGYDAKFFDQTFEYFDLIAENGPYAP